MWKVTGLDGWAGCGLEGEEGEVEEIKVLVLVPKKPETMVRGRGSGFPFFYFDFGLLRGSNSGLWGEKMDIDKCKGAGDESSLSSLSEKPPSEKRASELGAGRRLLFFSFFFFLIISFVLRWLGEGGGAEKNAPVK